MDDSRYLLGASEVSANLYCNSRTSVLGRLRDYLRLLMGRTLYYFTRLQRILSYHLKILSKMDWFRSGKQDPVYFQDKKNCSIFASGSESRWSMIRTTYCSTAWFKLNEMILSLNHGIRALAGCSPPASSSSTLLIHKDWVTYWRTNRFNEELRSSAIKCNVKVANNI